jgi:tRNA 2-thiouridine synthesizing protein B
MALLHTVNKSPFEKRTLESCLRVAVNGSSVLLLEDGVYAAMKGTVVEPSVREAMAKHKFYALGPDVSARGLDESNLIGGVELVDYAGFVDLTVAHDNVQSWL